MIRRVRRLWWEWQIESRLKAMRQHADMCCQGAADGPCARWEAMCDYWNDALERWKALA